MRAVLGFMLCLAAVGCGGSKAKTGSNDMAVSSTGDMAVANHKDMSATPTCNLAKQTGCTSTEKCIANLDKRDVASGICVTNGTVAAGSACALTNDDSELNDNCIGGTSCDSDGANAALICRKICSADTDCSTVGDKCLLIWDSSWGLCLPPCTPFSAECPTGNDCSANFDDIAATDASETGYFICKPTGTTGTGGNCTADGDCAKGLYCDANATGTCLPSCSNTISCSAGGGADAGAGLTCNPFPNLANGAGYCAP